MDIQRLRTKGAFIEGAPVPTTVRWTHVEDGALITDEFIVHVLRKSVGWMDRAFRKARQDEKGSRTAAIISEGIRFGENGSEKMSYEDACQLDFDLATALVDAFNEVNRQDADPKNSLPQTSSGASSSSAASVEGQ